jgi:nitrite reductase (NADH) small subunit
MSALMAAAEPRWIEAGAPEDIPLRGARRVSTARGDIALFRTGADEIYALEDRCPHKQGPLSQGIVHGRAVSCPLHAWVIDLKTGEPQGADHGKGCARTLVVRQEKGRLFVEAPGGAL